MSPRVVLVPQNALLLQDPSTEILHRYPNGELLIRTEARVAESEVVNEESIDQGVQLAGVSAAELEQARESLREPVQERFASEAERHRSASSRSPAPIMAYLELIGPVDPRWLDQLRSRSIELLQFQPAHTYLSRGTAEAFQQAAKLSFVLNVTPIVSALKPRPILPEAGEHAVRIVVQGDRNPAEVIQSLNNSPDVAIDLDHVEQVNFYLHLRATVTAEGQTQLLENPQVLAIEPYEAPQPEDEVAGLIIAGQYNAIGQPSGSYLRWLEDHGLNGAGVAIGIVDTGVDPTHEAYRDRITDLTGGRKSWHATFVAGHAAGCYLGEKDSGSFIYGLGIAPAAHLLSQDNQRTPTGLCKETVSPPAGIPGSVQNNSWGAGTRESMDYGSQEATYDRLVRNADLDSLTPKPLTICFSSGNSGAAGLTRPKSAKNILVTGNSENYRPDVGKDQSDNIREIYSGPRASSHGNCGDGRIRPHVVTAGEWTASANYDSHPGQREYISPKLTWGGGSSGASPKTAGACALLIQWWRKLNQSGDPSPAMLRSLIVNGAEPIESGGSIPNKIQGWGRLNLETILANCRRIYVDQTELLRQRGDEKQWSVRVADPKQPLKITLAWTDPPGAIGSGTATAPAIVNKLALRVEVNGELYRGNQFQNGWSYANGAIDREGWDNLQNVYLPAGVATGVIRVRIVAIEITTNCLTGQITDPQQDFALVITNAEIDKATTPAAVFVAVDRDAPAAKPSQSQFWANQPNSSDAYLTQFDWWKSIDPPPSSPPKPRPALDSWWADDRDWKTESNRQPVASDDKRLLQALQAGISIAAGAGYPVNLAAPSIAAEAENFDLSAIAALTRPLSETLTDLLKQWEQVESTQRRTAVLLVGGGTRISGEDLAAMRRLSFAGDLYLVSDDRDILTFLTQRLHRQVGIQIRFATDPRLLPTLLQDTIAEASGSQRVQVTATAGDRPLTTHYHFSVISADMHLSLRIYFLVNAVPRWNLIPPRVAIAPDKLNVTQSPSSIQLDLDAESLAVNAGEWRLEVEASSTDPVRVRVWAWSDLHLNFQQQAHPIAESDRVTEALIAVSNDEGIVFNRLQALPRVMGGAASETDRPVETKIEAPRQADDVAPYSPIISAWVPIPDRDTDSTVVDLPLRIEGMDAKGDRFTRLISHNLIQLQPYSTWRKNLTQANELLIIAQIAAVRMENNQVVSLTLQDGDRQRTVLVNSPPLRQQLTRRYQRRRLSFSQLMYFNVIDREVTILLFPSRQKFTKNHSKTPFADILTPI
jgi:subtilisin family serine protease